jgi:uncharacterized protein (TIGR00730 family)
LRRPEMRAARLLLEYLKVDSLLIDERIRSTIVVFGGTQILERQDAVRRLDMARESLALAPADVVRQRIVQRAEAVLAKSNYYDEARAFSRLVSASCQINGECEYVVVTGGGPGIMEAANRGAADVAAKSIGFNITLPEEQKPNPYITPSLCFQFRYFALRKMHFLLRAKALVVFPGGFGTIDELSDALTLRQTGRMQAIPIILYGTEYWKRMIDFEFMADEGVIRDEHLSLFSYSDSPEDAWRQICEFHAGEFAQSSGGA